MPDYRFTFTKTTDIIVEANTEHEAWVQALTVDPNAVPADWDIKLNESIKTDVPITEGPVEIDIWDAPDPEL
jgi:hypothetical protein